MFKNSIVALITPMKENGELDKNGLRNLIHYHIRSGTSAILILGTTGEYSTLCIEEKKTFITWVLEISNEKIPIIVGVIENSTKKAISVINIFKKIGKFGYLIVVPYYNQPNQNGIFEHFLSIAKEISSPCLLYNVPSRTGCDISPITIGNLSKIDNIVGIKESNKDLSRIQKIKSLVKKDFILLSGNDDTTLDFIQLGGDGTVSVTANIFAKEISYLCNMVKNKHFLKASNLNKRLLPIYNSLLCEPNPSSIKWMCKKLGLIQSDFVRLPILPASKKSVKILNKVLKSFRFDKLSIFK